MFYINTLNPLSDKGLGLFSADQYQLNQSDNPHAILVRSTSMHDMSLADSVRVIARAGAGTNNIPIEKMTEMGIPVLNTPGANANAVKELVLAGLLLASRHVVRAWDFCQRLDGDEKQQNVAVEKGKKQFVGSELAGKTLAVIGLGYIGVKVANSARQLGMNVIGYDPGISVQSAWKLRASVEQADSLQHAVSGADFVSVHVPLMPATEGLIDQELIQSMQPGVVLLNFARSPIVEKTALQSALESNHLGYYVCDFPVPELHGHPGLICLPHLGASTKEAQENCAVMAVEQVQAFLEHGHIINSVNFPSVKMARGCGYRLALVNQNIPNMVAQITSVLSERKLNILNMINQSRGDIAYTLIDLEQQCSVEQLDHLQNINGVVRARLVDE
jgi:D-3-phosphoglycerate dehydrogenase / 2-oxoglutarate reductase